MSPSSSKLRDGERIRKALSLKQIAPIQERLAPALAQIPALRYIKLFPERLTASNLLSRDSKNNPVVVMGGEGLVGVELLIDSAMHSIQFYALTSAVKGCGGRMVEAVLAATPEDWFIAVPMDWSRGFWERMAQKYPRLQVF